VIGLDELLELVLAAPHGRVEVRGSISEVKERLGLHGTLELERVNGKLFLLF